VPSPCVDGWPERQASVIPKRHELHPNATSGCISSRRATRSKAEKTFSKPSSPPTRTLALYPASSYMRRGGRCVGFQFRRNDSGSAPLDCQIVFAMSSSLLAFERAWIVPLRSAALPSFRKTRYLGGERTPPPWGPRSGWRRPGPSQPRFAIRRRARLTALASALACLSSTR